MNNKYPPSYFESQCWYKNTYLVSQTNYICESNSVYNSGCHFTCIAMMFGITPAYLSSLLSVCNYFTIDGNGLMWDQNRPFCKIMRSLFLSIKIRKGGKKLQYLN